MKNNSMKKLWIFLPVILLQLNCSKSDTPDPVPPPSGAAFTVTGFSVNGNAAVLQYGVNRQPAIRLSFSAPVNRGSVPAGIKLTAATGGSEQALSASYQNGDSVIVLQPSVPLANLTKYTVATNNQLSSAQSKFLASGSSLTFLTVMDSTDKFPVISDNALLDKVQQQTFKYFWDFGHPVSGMARERNSSGDIVTTGGTGFGAMAIVTAVSRGFISRVEGRDRLLKITNFLTTKCTTYHGAFSHWINGATGATQPFSANDNGGTW